jgi:hypothetical protein
MDFSWCAPVTRVARQVSTSSGNVPRWAQRKRSSGAERASQRNASTPTSSAGRTRSIVPFALLCACVKTTSFGLHTGAALHPLNSDSPGLDEWFREVTRGAREGHSEGCDDGRCGAARGCVTAGGEGLRSVDDDVPVWVSGGVRRLLARELRRVVATSLLGPLEGVGPVLVMGAGRAVATRRCAARQDVPLGVDAVVEAD